MGHILAYSITILALISLFTVLGDYWIKLSTTRPDGLASPVFILGALVYGSTAIGWFFLMRSHSLALIGVVYSAVTMIMLAALGYVMFKETLALRDWLGLSLAVAGVLVMRHD
jgi:drug/metabolite transporter (DMT)-like permease